MTKETWFCRFMLQKYITQVQIFLIPNFSAYRLNRDVYAQFLVNPGFSRYGKIGNRKWKYLHLSYADPEMFSTGQRHI